MKQLLHQASKSAVLHRIVHSERFIALRAVRRMALRPLQQAPMLSSDGTCLRLHLPELFVA